MKTITVKIPDDKVSFFQELFEQLGLEVEEEVEISEEHKAAVRERIKQSDENPERLLSWDQVRNTFRFD